VVRAKRPCFHPPCEVIGERRLALADPADSGAQPLGDGGASPFGRGGGLAVAAAEPHCCGELLGDRLDFRAPPLDAARVVELPRFFHLGAEILQPLAVLGFGLRIEQQ
jgi:hypothetical protein